MVRISRWRVPESNDNEAPIVVGIGLKKVREPAANGVSTRDLAVHVWVLIPPGRDATPATIGRSGEPMADADLGGGIDECGLFECMADLAKPTAFRHLHLLHSNIRQVLPA